MGNWWRSWLKASLSRLFKQQIIIVTLVDIIIVIIYVVGGGNHGDVDLDGW